MAGADPVGRGFRERGETLAVALALVAFFAAWHAAGVFGGEVYVAEDTDAYFASNRAVHHALARSGELYWWDPQPGLGQPRLANIQNGSFSPFSLLFYAFPPGVAFRFHPFLVVSALGLATFALFRRRGMAPLAAGFGALSWCTMAAVTTHFQHPPVFETLVWLPAALLGWECFIATRRARYAVAAGVAVAFQCFGSSPQYLLYNALVMALWVGEGIWRGRRVPGETLFRAGGALGIAAIGAGLGSWQLLPAVELARLGHRELLSDPTAFTDQFSAGPMAVLRALASEIFWVVPRPRIVPGLPYLELPNLSLLATGLAVLAVVRVRGSRAAWLAAGALFFLLGMLGSAGGVTTLLGWVLPFADRLRAPVRMVVPAGLLISALAALGLQQLPLRAPNARRLAALAACVWVALVGWTLKRPLDAYADPSRYDVPDVIAAAEGRLVVDAWRRPQTPLFAVNAGLAAGVPTLLQREVLIPRGFFEGYYASQLGSLRDTQRVDTVIRMAALLLVAPDAPLMRSYGLREIVRYAPQGPTSVRVAEPVARFRWVGDVRVPATPDALWAALRAGRWDPRETVFLREPLHPGLPVVPPGSPPAEIEVQEDTPDRQRLRVRSSGGLVVTSELLFPGWSVRVDGEPAEPVEVDLALRGVAVPPGEHEIEWQYRPTWLGSAWAGSALAALAAAALAVASRRARASRVASVSGLDEKETLDER